MDGFTTLDWVGVIITGCFLNIPLNQRLKVNFFFCFTIFFFGYPRVNEYDRERIDDYYMSIIIISAEVFHN